MAKRLLVVECSKETESTLQNAFGDSQYSLRFLPNLSNVVARTMEERPGLVLFDVLSWNQPLAQCLMELASLPVLRTTRRIILLSRGGMEDKIAALEAGADDFLLKPVSSRELFARVSALLRANNLFQNEEPISIGDLVPYRDSTEISVGGQRKYLSGREFNLLSHLMNNPGRVFSRDELLESVWVPWEIKEHRHRGCLHLAHSRENRIGSHTTAMAVDSARGGLFLCAPWSQQSHEHMTGSIGFARRHTQPAKQQNAIKGEGVRLSESENSASTVDFRA
jgi:DNA-binding response OmpR family regulator